MSISSHNLSRITWRCRRGMLELDLLLNRFLDNGIKHFSDEEILLFEDLLSFSDPELYSLLSGHSKINPNSKDKRLIKIVDIIRNHNNP